MLFTAEANLLTRACCAAAEEGRERGLVWMKGFALNDGTLVLEERLRVESVLSVLYIVFALYLRDTGPTCKSWRLRIFLRGVARSTRMPILAEDLNRQLLILPSLSIYPSCQLWSRISLTRLITGLNDVVKRWCAFGCCHCAFKVARKR